MYILETITCGHFSLIFCYIFSLNKLISKSVFYADYSEIRDRNKKEKTTMQTKINIVSNNKLTIIGRKNNMQFFIL